MFKTCIVWLAFFMSAYRVGAVEDPKSIPYKLKIDGNMIQITEKGTTLLNTDSEVHFEGAFPEGFVLKFTPYFKKENNDEKGNTIIRSVGGGAHDDKSLQITPPSGEKEYGNILLINLKDPNILKLEIEFFLNDEKMKIKNQDGTPAELIDLAPKKEKEEQAVVFATDVPNANTPGIDGLLPCSKVIPGVYYFIPPIESRHPFTEQGCVSCLNDYQVVFDMRSAVPQVCYYKRKKCKCEAKKDSTGSDDKNGKKPTNEHVASNRNPCQCKDAHEYCFKSKKRISPCVGSQVGFHFVGHSSTFDSLSVDFSFESRHLELRDQFQGVISPKASEETDVPEASGDDDDTTNTASGQNKVQAFLEFVQRMRDELRTYDRFLMLYAPQMALVKLDVEIINLNLDRYCISLEAYTSAALEKAIKEHLAALEENLEAAEKDADKRQAVLVAASMAASYYERILNYSAVTLLPVQMDDDDRLLYTVKLYNGNTEVQQKKYWMMASCGWKIDFSAGFALNNLLSHEYVFKYDTADLDGDGTADDVAQIIKKDKGARTIDLALMAHMYPRTGTYVNGGINTGFVIENGDVLKYLVGGSLMLGSKQRTVISGGWIMGSVDRLDNSYNDALNTYVDRARVASISTAIPTVKRWKTGGYVAITYNLGGAKLGGGN